MGNKKAAVFPLPVSALTKRSLCSNAGGMACCCTGVGCSKPSLLTAKSSGSASDKLENEDWAFVGFGCMNLDWLLRLSS